MGVHYKGLHVTQHKNYVTPFGFSMLQNELKHLLYEERPKVVDIVRWAAGNGDRSENGDYIYGKRRLREIDKRVRYLTKQINNAEIIHPKLQQHLTRVYFGATVVFRDDKHKEHKVQLVGFDEADLSEKKINYQSPLAKALLKATIGDTVCYKTPTGKYTVEIIAIDYILDEGK